MDNVVSAGIARIQMPRMALNFPSMALDTRFSAGMTQLAEETIPPTGGNYTENRLEQLKAKIIADTPKSLRPPQRHEKYKVKSFSYKKHPTPTG